jgi:uncharacterized 2Fe-2S/4Fe-4S cluster protein (DUF4445 family)
MPKYRIYFQPLGLRGECSDKETILECARRLGAGINNVCGGNGTCGACKIRIVSGSAPAPVSREAEVFSRKELKDGWRLACQSFLIDDITVMIPPESMTTPQRLQTEGAEVATALEPPIKTFEVQLKSPDINDLEADADRLISAVNKQTQFRVKRIDYSLLKNLSDNLRELDWNCQAAVRGDEIISVNKPGRLQLGLSVDIGTTKIAGYLADFKNGKTMASRGLVNPQIIYGEDVISRINRAMKSEDDRSQLQNLVVGAVNQLAVELCAEIGAKTGDILEVVVAGNTAMHHLFLGLPVRQLVLSPFVPAISSAFEVKARELNIQFAPGAYVYFLPNIAGFVGADHVAALLATRLWKTEETSLIIDIGTNTEISLYRKGKIAAVSCASGPAFEGGHIKCGMRAGRGAIERVHIDGEGIHYQTIEDASPLGICGSGILDTIAQLYLNGAIDGGGRLNASCPGVRKRKEQLEFVLVGKQGRHPEIVVTQADIRELQLAKAAIRTGIQVLINANHCTENDIDRVIIAGAFGSYIDVNSAIAIGLLPSLSIKKFSQIGNAAGTGSRLALINLNERTLARKISKKVRYIELAGIKDFTKLFLQAGYLGEYRL